MRFPQMKTRRQTTRRLARTTLALGALVGASSAAVQESVAQASTSQMDITIRSGQSIVYDTAFGPLVLDNLTIEAGATVRVVGTRPLYLFAHGAVVVEGLLDLSGFDAKDVATLNTSNQPEPGAAGGPAGGTGGTASASTTSSTPAGGDGEAFLRAGGGGGESGFSVSPLQNNRRPGGGGGGALAADMPVHPDPSHPSNVGLIAEAGNAGSPRATGAVNGLNPPQGGAAGASIFSDLDPRNDFWGVKRSGGASIVGELSYPTSGAGGGAGGDAIEGGVFPPAAWGPSSDEKGAGGGGGGGLGFLVARSISLGASGSIRANGGAGAYGENVLFLDRIGGESGGGSGGYLVMQAETIDLSSASSASITALGGRGAKLSPNLGSGGGGNGGPGVIQLHLADPSQLLLPAGASLGELTRPQAHVLLPVRSVLPH